jgi:hypothetical protein
LSSSWISLLVFFCSPPFLPLCPFCAEVQSTRS